MLDAFESIKSLLYYMLSRLSQHLHCHIVGDEIIIDKLSQELVLCLRSCRESHFNFLEAQLHQIFEEFNLFLKAHRYYQCLVAVPQVNAAPDRSLFDMIFCHPAVAGFFRREVSHLILVVVFHIYLHSFL